MTPEFAGLVNEVFDIVLDLVDRIERREQPDLGREKALIRQSLGKLTSNDGDDTGLKLSERELAQRALVYWVDEIITEAQPDWVQIKLEVDYFGENNRAWRFYEYGEKNARVSSSDVIETWYLCLVLGFKGSIGEAFREHLHMPLPGGTTKENEARKAWAADLARLIRKPSLPEMNGEPLVGGAEPLMGANSLQTVAFFLFVFFVGFIALIPIYYRLGSQ